MLKSFHTQSWCTSRAHTRLVPPARAAAVTTLSPPSLRTLHDARQPYFSGKLVVEDGHSLAISRYGTIGGPAALVLHGGPGAACWPNHSRFFDLNFWDVVLMDQRGCGQSTPRGCLAGNNTSALVEDIETLRQQIGADKLMLFGGSWGVALALVYASKYPRHVSGIVLRGVCLMRSQEINWMYGGGCGMLRPAAWARFVGHLAPEERGDVLLSYYERLLSKDASVRDAAARSWMDWEGAVGFSAASKHMQWWDGHSWRVADFPAPDHTGRTPPTPALAAAGGVVSRAECTSTAASDASHRQQQQPSEEAHMKCEEARTTRLMRLTAATSSFHGEAGMPHASVQALLEAHYSVHHAFELAQQPLLAPERIAALRGIPCIAVQGAEDLVCPPGTAYALHDAWPEMELRLVPGAGHSMYDPPITHELLGAVEAMKQVAV